MKTAGRCETCRFWKPDAGKDEADEADGAFSGVCRRYPPAVNHAYLMARAMHVLRADPEEDAALDVTFDDCHGNQPRTLHDAWCGEWKPKE